MKERSFVNSELILSVLARDAPWSEGHGVTKTHLGGGMLYYAIAYALKAELCICVGSGGALVPRIMRQAQRDMGGIGETHLVDGNVVECKWGSPNWVEPNSFFRKEFRDIILYFERSDRAAREIFAGREADYIHLDADHSYEGCRGDVDLYLPLLKPTGIMTLHDTMLHERDPECGVHRVVAELRQSADCDVVELPFIGRGIAIVRPVASPGP